MPKSRKLVQQLRRDGCLDFIKCSVYLLIWVVYVFTWSHSSTCLPYTFLSWNKIFHVIKHRFCGMLQHPSVYFGEIIRVIRHICISSRDICTMLIFLNKIWKDKDITITTKCRIVSALVFPVVLYGCESWPIRKAERRRIDSFELWWRLLRISYRTNKSVIEEIKATNPLEVLSYFGHIMRRENSLEKSIMLGMGGGSRKGGRPRARWLDDMKAVTNYAVQQEIETPGGRWSW